ncbi:MAG: hypothetical protein ACJ71G_07175 [Nitrososphaeraceae archaeon]
MHARREQFKEFLLSTIDQYFDSDIYEMEVKRKQRQESKRITGLANQMIEQQFPLEEGDGD